MELLGDLIDARGSSLTSFTHRQEWANAGYFRNRSLLRRRAELGARLHAWSSAPAASAIYGAETWQATSALLHNAKSWERKRLRDMFRMKWKPGEGQQAYNMRTTNVLHCWFSSFCLVSLHHRILKSIYRAAWFEDKITVGDGARPLHEARSCRDALWWESIKDIPTKRRRLENLSQARQGHKVAWEDMLVDFVSIDWRHKRETSESIADWMDGWEQFCNRCCSCWHLPQLPAPTNPCPDAIFRPWKCPRVRSDLEDTPMNEWPDWRWNWQGNGQRVFVLVDNQLLANLVNGQAALKQLTFRPPLVRISRRLRQFWQMGVHPKRNHDLFVKCPPVPITDLLTI